MLNDQSGLVLGDSTVISWAGCHKICLRKVNYRSGNVDRSGLDFGSDFANVNRSGNIAFGSDFANVNKSGNE
jgi:hypothetical protein